MRKSITRRLVDTVPMVPGGYNPTLTKCSECKKHFERLSEKWAYHFKKDGKDIWQCSWRCHRAAEARLYPKKVLRGEYFAEHESENSIRYKAAARARALENKGQLKGEYHGRDDKNQGAQRETLRGIRTV